MSFKIEKGSYTNTLDSASLSGNQTIMLPNATGTVALTNQLATVATSGSYNDLSNKPNIPANQSGYITQTWRSGNNWYRKWSDGWIEQGGRGTTVTGAYKTFQLPTEFTTTSYTIVGGSHTGGEYVYFTSLTVSSFQAMGQNHDGATYAMNFHFYAAGV